MRLGVRSLLLVCGLSLLGGAGCSAAAADEGLEVTECGARATKGALGMLHIDRGMLVARDYGVALGSYKTGITCASTSYQDGSCDVLFAAPETMDSAKSVVFRGATARAIRGALGSNEHRGPDWTLLCSGATCRLELASPHTPEWRPASIELESGELTDVQLETLRREVTVE